MIGYLVSSASQSTTNGITISLELFLSVLALIFSIGSSLFEYFWNQKINKTNLEAEFFKDIYSDYLMKKIPDARNVIHYNDNIVSDTDDLIEVLNDIRQSSLFYKYKDRNFYNLLCKQLQELEDKLVSKTGQMSDDDYASFVQEINSDIENIYDTIMKKYIGKKVKK